MAEIEEIDDFNELIAEKRHKDIIEVLKGIHNGMDAPKTIEAINRQRECIEKLLVEIEKDRQENKLIPVTIATISKAIIKKIEAINENKSSDKVWKFEIKRGKDGLMQEVIAKQV
jgi:hypothetical protein